MVCKIQVVFAQGVLNPPRDFYQRRPINIAAHPVIHIWFYNYSIKKPCNIHNLILSLYTAIVNTQFFLLYFFSGIISFFPAHFIFHFYFSSRFLSTTSSSGLSGIQYVLISHLLNSAFHSRFSMEMEIVAFSALPDVS
jgi:hypothetical protein